MTHCKTKEGMRLRQCWRKVGIPASPFRTNGWKGITEEHKFTMVNKV
jgi:hypothetical protein